MTITNGAPVEGPLVRIGELARRAGLPPATLRAWERRYGIVEPVRTEGGYRLYSSEDERRLKAMLELITGGIAPAEAAARVLAEPVVREQADNVAPAGAPEPGRVDAAALRDELRAALLAFDEPRCHQLIDSAIAVFSVQALLIEVLLPVMRSLGEGWRLGEVSVAQEHFATAVVRSRVLPLTRGWGAGSGSLALLACAPGEEHDLGLIAFGLLLRERGWRVVMFGANTPISALTDAARRMQPQSIVLAVIGDGATGFDDGLAELPDVAPVLVGGAGATAELAERLGAELLSSDLVTAVDQLTGQGAGR